MQRINVVGTSASGKSTFAKQLSEKLQLGYIEIDDWQETPDAEFFQKIKNAIAYAEHHPDKQGYVIDGNYTRTVPLTWKNIDTVIWLDFPFALNLFQSVKRALSRTISKQPFWENSNNTESFKQMLSRDSIILWMIKRIGKSIKTESKILNMHIFNLFV